MSRTKEALSKGSKISYDLSIGVLCTTFKAEKIRAILTATGRTSKRKRDLPAEVVVYYVIAMCLFMQVNSKEVLRCLLEGLRHVFGRDAVKVTGKSGISQARSRVGSTPLKHLHDSCVKPIACAQTRGAYYRDWKLVSLDGSTLDLPDEALNREAYGKHGAKGGKKAPYPQIRFVSLVENGTHVLFGSRMAPINVGEGTIAREVIASSLLKGMLCLADRLFYGYEQWEAAAKTGADLLWRMRNNNKLEPETILKDGSYLSRVNKKGQQKISTLVRVIEYSVKGSQERYRLITTILDSDKAPAAELASLYGERWEVEGALDELKTHLRGAQVCLRSKTPELVEQEFYGLMLAHFAVRGLMHEAALKADEDPDRLSYAHTIRVIRRKIPLFQTLSPSASKRISSRRH